jgi:hypothetical protein
MLLFLSVVLLSHGFFRMGLGKAPMQVTLSAENAIVFPTRKSQVGRKYRAASAGFIVGGGVLHKSSVQKSTRKPMTKRKSSGLD